jgi:hypothetical protein
MLDRHSSGQRRRVFKSGSHAVNRTSRAVGPPRILRGFDAGARFFPQCVKGWGSGAHDFAA